MNEPHDPKLPILAELERDVTRAAERALGPRRATQGSRTRGEHPAGRQGRRVVRRALLLVALILLIGATALAATGAFDGGSSDEAVRGSVLEAAHGSAGGGYRILLHAQGHTLCQVLVLEAGVASKCERPPRHEAVEPLSALAGNERFVFGVAGPETRSLVVRVGGHHLRVSTRPVEATAARAAGVDPHVRIFLATFRPRPGSASQPPAIVAGQVDCSLTTVSMAVCEPR